MSASMPPSYSREPDPVSRCDWKEPATPWELNNLLAACKAHNWTLCLLPCHDDSVQVTVTRRPGGTHRPQETWSGKTTQEALENAWTGVRRWARERAARGTK